MSVFTLSLSAIQGWLYHQFSRHLHWPLPAIDADSGYDQWLQAQADPFIFETVRP